MALTLLKKSLEIVESDAANKTEKQKEQRSKAKQYANRSAPRKDRVIKVKDIREELKLGEKKTKENLKRLLALSKNTLKETEALKFVKRAHKGRYEDIELPKREIESIFTDEDFQAFEEEYFKS